MAGEHSIGGGLRCIAEGPRSGSGDGELVAGEPRLWPCVAARLRKHFVREPIGRHGRHRVVEHHVVEHHVVERLLGVELHEVVNLGWCKRLRTAGARGGPRPRRHRSQSIGKFRHIGHIGGHLIRNGTRSNGGQHLRLPPCGLRVAEVLNFRNDHLQKLLELLIELVDPVVDVLHGNFNDVAAESLHRGLQVGLQDGLHTLKSDKPVKHPCERGRRSDALKQQLDNVRT
mmetsp:Transcript_103336/g.262428  ORF Transcript_103336/g.262428 Transcript_103336/m.262428 type:complete len:229 (-) Transcript_103336:574-1260(-)